MREGIEGNGRLNSAESVFWAWKRRCLEERNYITGIHEDPRGKGKSRRYFLVDVAEGIGEIEGVRVRRRWSRECGWKRVLGWDMNC